MSNSYCFLALTGIFLTVAGPIFACDPPPPAVVDIEANSYYVDKHHSIIDEALRAQNRANVKPLEDFLSTVSTGASDFQSHPEEHLQEGQCALTWLSAWAEQGAMLGRMTAEQSYYERKWMLAGLALSYAKVQKSASATQKVAIEKWLKTLAMETIEHSDRYKNPQRNNHYYWEGLAVTATGAVTHDRRFLDWGKSVFYNAMDQIQNDGSLPRELDRGQMATHYHAVAAAPLVVMASILNLQDPRLDKLVAFCLRGFSDPGYLGKLTGVAQKPFKSNELSWLAVYCRHESNPSVENYLASVKTSTVPRLGGNLAVANPLENVVRQ